MSKPDQYYPDGFRHGFGLPDDVELDQMIYPELPPKPDMTPFPMGMPYEEYMHEKEEREHAEHERQEQEDRQFTMTEGNVTGQHPGPPRTR